VLNADNQIDTNATTKYAMDMYAGTIKTINPEHKETYRFVGKEEYGIGDEAFKRLQAAAVDSLAEYHQSLGLKLPTFLELVFEQGEVDFSDADPRALYNAYAHMDARHVEPAACAKLYLPMAEKLAQVHIALKSNTPPQGSPLDALKDELNLEVDTADKLARELYQHAAAKILRDKADKYMKGFDAKTVYKLRSPDKLEDESDFHHWFNYNTNGLFPNETKDQVGDSDYAKRVLVASGLLSHIAAVAKAQGNTNLLHDVVLLPFEEEQIIVRDIPAEEFRNLTIQLGKLDTPDVMYIYAPYVHEVHDRLLDPAKKAALAGAVIPTGFSGQVPGWLSHLVNEEGISYPHALALAATERLPTTNMPNARAGKAFVTRLKQHRANFVIAIDRFKIDVGGASAAEKEFVNKYITFASSKSLNSDVAAIIPILEEYPASISGAHIEWLANYVWVQQQVEPNNDLQLRARLNFISRIASGKKPANLAVLIQDNSLEQMFLQNAFKTGLIVKKEDDIRPRHISQRCLVSTWM